MVSGHSRESACSPCVGIGTKAGSGSTVAKVAGTRVGLSSNSGGNFPEAK